MRDDARWKGGEEKGRWDVKESGAAGRAVGEQIRNCCVKNVFSITISFILSTA